MANQIQNLGCSDARETDANLEIRDWAAPDQPTANVFARILACGFL
jgi:hypothetical protein